MVELVWAGERRAMVGFPVAVEKAFSLRAEKTPLKTVTGQAEAKK